MNKTQVFSLRNNPHVEGTLTSVTVAHASLSDVPMTLMMGEYALNQGTEVLSVLGVDGKPTHPLPPEPFLALGLQRIFLNVVEVRGEAIEPGIYNMVGLLPLSELPVAAATPQFTAFTGFLSRAVGQRLYWGSSEGGILLQVRGTGEEVLEGFLLRSPGGIVIPRA